MAAGVGETTDGRLRLPRFSASVLALTLAGFVAASFLHVEVAWVAAAGALVLAVRAVWTRQARPAHIASAANLPFLAFVLALGIVVRAVVDNGLATAMTHIVPAGDSLLALLGWAGLAAVLANLVNNLPAVLILLPLAAGGGAGPVLAVLIGGERRSQPDLRGLAGDPAVAQDRARPRP